MKKRLLSIALALCLVFTLLPVSAFAATTASGECGENLTWTLDSNGTLTISGTGEMTGDAWRNYRSSIKSVVINDGVTRIGGWVFDECDSLTSVTIPDSVKIIEKNAFEGCSNLKNVYYNGDIEAWLGIDFKYSSSNPCYNGSDLYFNGKLATDIVIPSSVTSIRSWALFGCSSLKSVTIHDGVTDIPWPTFERCSNLESIIVDKGNEEYCSVDGVLFSKDKTILQVYPEGKANTTYVVPDGVEVIVLNAFSYSYNLTSVTIPDGVTEISEWLFDHCINLTSVTLPDSATYIGNWAFSGCSSLPNITIPDSVTYIGKCAFYKCSNLKSVKMGSGVKAIAGYAFEECSSLEKVTMPDSVVDIGSGTFLDCSSLASVAIGGGAESISASAFNACSSLTSITVDNNNKYFCSDNGVLFNKDKTELHTYPAGKSNTSYTIPKSVTSIGSYAFYDCGHLTSVTIPNSVTSIGYAAFEECSSLTNAVIPDSVTIIDSNIFFGCSSLTKVVIPDSVTNIDYNTFRNCSKLKSVTIPDSITNIKSYAFYGCNSLTDVYYGGTASQWKAISIDTGNELLLNAKLHYAGVPAAPVIKITTSAGKPKISWSKVDGAAKYKVFYSTDGKKYNPLIETTKTSITHTKAKIGTKYYYVVKAVNAGAESEFSNGVSIKCRPAAPTVTISRVSGKAKLSWKKVSGATKYWVYRSTDGKKYTRVISTTKLSYADSKSKSGTKYYYKVMAVAVVNKTNVGSAFSAVKSIMTTLAKPTVKITTASGKPKLSWSKVTGADKYYVYRSTNGKDYTLLIKTTKTSVTNTGAKKGTKYYYKVKAICSANTKANSAFSTVVSIKATK